MVYGRGEPIGPDLSNVGTEKSLDQIREALLQPSKHITPGYELASVRLRDGTTIRGFARGRTNFDIQLQDLEGRFHLLQESQIAAIDDEKQSPMPATRASPQELQDLIAYLSQPTSSKAGAPPAARPSEGEAVDFSRILHPRPGDWLSYNGKLNGNRYSDLTQINTTNISKVVVKWTFSIPLWSELLPDTAYFIENMQYFGLETVPLVADGIMYVTGPHQAFALDALTGRQIWRYSRPRTPGVVGDASLGTNKGVALLGDKIFMVTDNAHLIALKVRTMARSK